MKLKRKRNCNRCDPLGGACKGRPDSENCKRYRPPHDTWMLAELALNYPTGLHEALSALPFECDLNFYLKG